jgi:hypothetical protein
MGYKTIEAQREQVRRWRRNNPERAKKHLNERNWRVLGIKTTYEEYKERERRQGGLCAICSQPPKKKALHQDHWHGNGQPRDLLCTKCNVALGIIEGPNLESYLRYLVKWNNL